MPNEPNGSQRKSLVLDICTVGGDKTDSHTQHHQQMWAISSSLQIQGSPTLNTDSMDMNVSKFQETVKDRGAQWATAHGGRRVRHDCALTHTKLHIGSDLLEQDACEAYRWAGQKC